MGDSSNSTGPPLSRKRTERFTPEPDAVEPASKKQKALVPSDSFAEVLKDMPKNDLSTAPRPVFRLDQPLVFQYITVHPHGTSHDTALIFGITAAGVRVLAHVRNLSTLPRHYKYYGQTPTAQSHSVQIFTQHYKVKPMSWMEIPVGKYRPVPESEKLSYNQTEFIIICNDIVFHPGDRWSTPAPLRILSFDIETRVRLDNEFTNYNRIAELPVIQIGNILSLQGEVEPYRRSIFTLQGCNEIEGVEVKSYPDEVAMLLAWKEFIIATDPDVVIGHNIARFDFIYLFLRANTLGATSLSRFFSLGRLKDTVYDINPSNLTVDAPSVIASSGKPAPNIRWWKDAPVLAGRLQLDINQYVAEGYARLGRPFKSKSALDVISREFLNLKKEDLDYTTINSLQDGDGETRRRLAVYCMKDTYLPMKLINCPRLRSIEESVQAARQNQQYMHLPFGQFLKVGRNV
ncbi:ribonuclease H-like domain-containing protein [Mycena rebaudengoi]|nr:ribonuclease H-like domain-containing protein [Mycena rebaudengoi]